MDLFVNSFPVQNDHFFQKDKTVYNYNLNAETTLLYT